MPPPELADRTRRKIARRILPFVFILYIVAYLDRANVAFAKLAMSEELGFSEQVYGFGVGVFFLGYILLEIPGALLVERFGARRWMARILVSWGVVACLTGFVRTSGEFQAARFVLGCAEAGFFPGIVVHLTHWFTGRDRARALAGFITAIPVSLVLGGPASAPILKLDWLGLAGWRWMFILEGLPAVILGVVAWFYLTDRPADACWLEPEEREWIQTELEAERARKREAGRVSVGQALRQPNVLLLAAALCLGNIAAYSFVFWLPSTIHDVSGLSDSKSAALAAVPFLGGLLAIVASGWSSDRTGERKLHALVPLIVAAAAFSLSALPGQRLPAVLAWLFLTAAAMYAFPPPFWVLPTLTLGESAAAASIGLINSVGNLGGFLGPLIEGHLLARFPRQVGVAFLSTSLVAAAALVSLVRVRRAG